VYTRLGYINNLEYESNPSNIQETSELYQQSQIELTVSDFDIDELCISGIPETEVSNQQF